MKCENCNKDHDGEYGSGRFCSVKCARGFSTKANREEINKKVSKSLTGKNISGEAFKKGFDSRRYIFCSETNKINAEKRWKKEEEKQKQYYVNEEYDKLSMANGLINKWYKKIIKEEQENKCIYCGNNEWMGQPLLIEIHHKDGNKYNQERTNLEAICPNCHSITPNWKTRGGINKYHALLR